MICGQIIQQVLKEKFPELPPPLANPPVDYNEDLRYYLMKISSHIPIDILEDNYNPKLISLFETEGRTETKAGKYRWLNNFEINIYTGKIWIYIFGDDKEEFPDFPHIMEYIVDWLTSKN